jgi:hypothetical protein
MKSAMITVDMRSTLTLDQVFGTIERLIRERKQGQEQRDDHLLHYTTCRDLVKALSNILKLT